MVIRIGIIQVELEHNNSLRAKIVFKSNNHLNDIQVIRNDKHPLLVDHNNYAQHSNNSLIICKQAVNKHHQVRNSNHKLFNN